MHPQYIQHNVAAGDTKEGILSILPFIPKTGRISTIRIFQDGDYVFTHNLYNISAPAKVVFDVYRFEDGKVVEHWDNIQTLETTPNPAGRTMLDGTIQPTQLTLAQTAANKALVKSYIRDVLMGGNIEKLPEYFHEDQFIQHAPGALDGPVGFNGSEQTYNRIRMVLGDGNFVLAMGEGTAAGVPTAFYNLYRVENGKLAEHWNVIESILPRDQWNPTNNNGRF
ncbi:hypothetical protein BV898_04601 [Hypsibius exemplaris]|uniref:SnoaL-like domain-containing protein n=1 Tax=Hypsibius exemplaris TaxID=2072580 RepID=A0A1W0X250_HYPEX|nr:hypothetical protein BV898_04601 [Hypsibius exemplaris]